MNLDYYGQDGISQKTLAVNDELEKRVLAQ